MIGSEYAPDRYIGNDSTTVFSFNFKIYDEDHLRVVIADANDANEAVLTKDTHYTISGVGEDSGGNITLLDIRGLTGESVVETLPTGWSITLKIDIPLKQLTNYHNQGGYFAETHEDSFDLLTQICQQLQEELNRALKVSETSGDTGSSLDEDFLTILTDCQTARTGAESAQTAAEAAQTAAEAAQTAAEASETNAAASETAAAASALSASNSAAAALVQWRFGSGAPSAGLGIDGDNYMDTDTDEIYHKESGSWVLKGDVTGATGSNGSDGTDGQTIVTGSVPPTAGDGVDGDYFIDNVAWNIYGPKAAGSWPAAQSIIGPAGAGSGDVLGPATHADELIPQWDGVNSKTLKAGLGIASPLAITGGNIAMPFTSGDFTTSGGQFALSATGVTSGSYTMLAGVSVDAGGRLTGGREAVITDYVEDVREVQDDFILSNVDFSTATVDTTDLIEQGVSAQLLWGMGPATLVSVDGRVNAADTGTTGPAVYMTISGASVFASNLTLTETLASASLTSGSLAISDGQRVKILSASNGSNGDADTPHLTALWRLG